MISGRAGNVLGRGRESRWGRERYHFGGNTERFEKKERPKGSLFLQNRERAKPEKQSRS